MDTGITNISRGMGPVQPELDLKKPPSVEKQAAANSTQTDQKITQAEQKAGVEPEKERIDENDLDNMVTQINDALQNEKRSIRFNVDKDSGRTVIKVIDAETGEKIKQIPAEEVLKISRKLAEQLEQEDMSGMLLTGQV